MGHPLNNLIPRTLEHDTQAHYLTGWVTSIYRYSPRPAET